MGREGPSSGDVILYEERPPEQRRRRFWRQVRRWAGGSVLIAGLVAGAWNREVLTGRVERAYWGWRLLKLEKPAGLPTYVPAWTLADGSKPPGADYVAFGNGLISGTGWSYEPMAYRRLMAVAKPVGWRSGRGFGFAGRLRNGAGEDRLFLIHDDEFNAREPTCLAIGIMADPGLLGKPIPAIRYTWYQDEGGYAPARIIRAIADSNDPGCIIVDFEILDVPRKVVLGKGRMRGVLQLDDRIVWQTEDEAAVDRIARQSNPYGPLMPTDDN